MQWLTAREGDKDMNCAIEGDKDMNCAIEGDKDMNCASDCAHIRCKATAVNNRSSLHL